ncbi:MAG: hypothetical protein IJR87_01110 [Bacteroidaceae bacterium]|nr:hypothetical protein [Bacteroidaceae bacterium]
MCLTPSNLLARKAQSAPAAYRATPDASLLQRPFGAADRGTFLHPDRIFYPETWFHFVNGNVGREGITRDLEAIAASGIQGVQLFHGRIGRQENWPGTEDPIECLSPKWEDLVCHTASEAHRMGLRFSLQTCPGWAMSGGPWIKPEQAMRHISYTRTDIAGGTAADQTLELPKMEEWRDWRDICVLAFPTPQGDNGSYCQVEAVEASSHQQEWERLLRQERGFSFQLAPTTPDKPYRVSFRLKDAATMRSIEFNPIDNFNHDFGVRPDVHIRLLATHQHEAKVVLDADFPRANWQDSEHTMTFAVPDRSDHGEYTLEITNLHNMRLSSLRFSTAARGHNWEMEAGWTSRGLLRMTNSDEETPLKDGPYFVNRAHVIDISDCMDAKGRLRWNAPASHAKWTILRIGHVNTGRQNGPAPAEATGWEVNKLDTAYVSHQFRSYIGRLVDGPLRGQVNNMLMDSWECASQTWTRYMFEEFQQRRHYDLHTWLPAILGWVMDDREQTSQFLDDWRRTLNELFADNFFGHMSRLAHEKGMTVSYETAAGDIFPADPLEFYKYADVPMTEYWQPFHNFLANRNYKPIRGTASAARMYGKPRVSAESFTSFQLTWDEHLSMLREVANQNMLEGVTHTVFHTYTHNPNADRYFPGSSFGGGIGTPFLRKQTWWPYMKNFNTYLARCAFMLERGRPVSSVLWYLGDETEQKPDQFTPFPEGFKYDYCNTDALLNRISVKDGQWVTPEGIRYDLLWIPQTGRLLPQTVERIAQLVAAGGSLAAAPAPSSATLSSTEREAWRFRHASTQIWGAASPLAPRVFTGSLEQAIRQLGLKPDVKPTALKWMHRQADGADWYMVCPAEEQSFSGEVAFRQTGRAEIWNPMNGSVTPVAARTDGEYSTIRLDLKRGQMFFIVFRHDGTQTAEVPAATEPRLCASPAAWTLTFPAGWGIDAPLTLNELQPWKDLPLSGEGKAFSGTATYETTIQLDAKDKRHRYTLDLGKVEEIAVVRVNGHTTDTLWAEPYETDITAYVRRGQNKVSIQVTSTWFNRLVYDAGLPEEQRRTWVINGPGKDNALRPSGLIGPVKMLEY